MNIESFREYCIAKPFVTEEFPFDASTLVFKVAGKMFALVDLDSDFVPALKCDPEESIRLQERHACITGAYHMNKKHWINVHQALSFDEKLLRKLIDDSYLLVVSSLPLKVRKELQML